MKLFKSILCAAILGALAFQPALAADKAKAVRADVECEASKQPAAESKGSRSDVKAEAQAATRAGAIECGEAGKPVAVPPTSKSRTEVKKEAAAAAKAGKLSQGEAGEPKK